MKYEYTPRDLALIVASLAAKYGPDFNQGEFARRLGTSQSTVSRALAAAKSDRLLVTKYRFTGMLSPAAALGVSRFERDEAELLQRLRALEHDQNEIALHFLEVFDEGMIDPEKAGSLPRAEDKGFSIIAGNVLTDWLVGVDRIGVTWGGSIYHALANVDLDLLTDPVPICMPTCGNIRTGRGQYTSTTIAGNFNERASWPKEVVEANSLAVNAFIPIEYGEAAEERRKFAQVMLESSIAYRDILGGFLDRPDDHPAKQFGTLITSIGRDNKLFGRNQEDFKRVVTPRGLHFEEEADRNIERLQKWFVGEFAGNLLRNDLELSEPEQIEADRFSNLWTGVNIKNIREIARRSNNLERKGVIVIGSGAERARTFIQAVRLGLISKALIDRALFDALTEEVEKIG